MHDILQQILYFFGGGFCHQFPERSLEAGGLYFSVCARDTGINLGFIITLIVLFVFCARLKDKPGAMPPFWAVWVGIVLAIPMVVDGTTSYLGLRETTNLIRYLSGYLCGTGLAVVASGGVLSLATRVDHQSSAVGESGRLSGLLAISIVAGVAFYMLYPSLGAVAPFVAFACQWLAVLLINLLIVSTTRFWPRGHRTGHDTRGRGIPGIGRRVLVVVSCSIAAGVEMAALSLLASGLALLFPWYVHP